MSEESFTDSSISTLSTVPSSILAMDFSGNQNESTRAGNQNESTRAGNQNESNRTGNQNESNRPDVDSCHGDRGDAYIIIDPTEPVEKEGSDTVDNIASEIASKKRQNKRTGFYKINSFLKLLPPHLKDGAR